MSEAGPGQPADQADDLFGRWLAHRETSNAESAESAELASSPTVDPASRPGAAGHRPAGGGFLDKPEPAGFEPVLLRSVRARDEKRLARAPRVVEPADAPPEAPLDAIGDVADGVSGDGSGDGPGDGSGDVPGSIAPTGRRRGLTRRRRALVVVPDEPGPATEQSASDADTDLVPQPPPAPIPAAIPPITPSQPAPDLAVTPAPPRAVLPLDDVIAGALGRRPPPEDPAPTPAPAAGQTEARLTPLDPGWTPPPEPASPASAPLGIDAALPEPAAAPVAEPIAVAGPTSPVEEAPAGALAAFLGLAAAETAQAIDPQVDRDDFEPGRPFAPFEVAHEAVATPVLDATNDGPALDGPRPRRSDELDPIDAAGGTTPEAIAPATPVPVADRPPVRRSSPGARARREKSAASGLLAASRAARATPAPPPRRRAERRGASAPGGPVVLAVPLAAPSGPTAAPAALSAAPPAALSTGRPSAAASASTTLPAKPSAPIPLTPYAGHTPLVAADGTISEMPPVYTFKPRRSARRVLTLMLLAGLAATVGLGIPAFRDRGLATMTLAGIAGLTTLVIWAIRIGATVTTLTVRTGQLEVVRQGSRFVFDLSSRYTPVEVVGTPGRRGWKVMFLRRSMPAFVVTAGLVDPKDFMRVLRFYRPEV